MYGENTTIDAMQRVQEEMDSLTHRHEGKDRATVRKIATAVLQDFGHKNNLDDIRLDGRQWQISYEGSLPFKDRTALEQLIAEQLGVPADGVKLVGVGC